MPTTVKMPDGSTAQFPDGMSPQDIQGAIEQHLSGAPADTHPAGLPAGMELPGLPAHPAVSMPTPTGASLVPAALQVGEFGKGVMKSGVGTVANLDSFARQHLPAAMTNQWLGFGAPTDIQHEQQLAATHNTAQEVGKVAGNIGQFLIPGGAEEGIAAKAAPYVGKALPVLKMGLSALGAGTVNAAQGGSFGAGAAGGALGSGVGQGVKALSPSLAESALGIRGADRMYGRTVGDAILNDTQGLGPDKVTRTAKQTVGQLVPQLETAASDAGAAGSRGSLTPVRQAVANKVGTLQTQRAVNSAAELQPLDNFLKTDQVTGLPLSSTQTPIGLLNMKRGLDADFIGNWNPTRNSRTALDTAKSAYGNLADEFHAAAPSTADLDQRISSLIPVMDRGQRTALNAGVPEMILHSLRAPTGALAGTLGGAYEGEKQGGLKGAVIGGTIGAIAPKLISSPAFLMGAARSANSLAIPSMNLLNGAAQQYFRPSMKDKENSSDGTQ